MTETSPNALSAFKDLEAFVEQRPEFNEAFLCLKKNAEISVKIDDLQCVLKSVDNKVRLISSPARRAEVEFLLTSAAASQLARSKPSNMGELGVQVLKSTAEGEIQIKVVGSVLSVLTGGYLSIIQKAGPEFMGFMARKGLKGLSKISAVIKKLKT